MLQIYTICELRGNRFVHNAPVCTKPAPFRKRFSQFGLEELNWSAQIADLNHAAPCWRVHILLAMDCTSAAPRSDLVFTWMMNTRGEKTPCVFRPVRRAARRYSLREMMEGDDWTLFWTDCSVSLERVKDMKRYQVLQTEPAHSDSFNWI